MGADGVEDERSDRDDRLNPIKEREAVKGWCQKSFDGVGTLGLSS